jgi:hypothetical protein
MHQQRLQSSPDLTAGRILTRVFAFFVAAISLAAFGHAEKTPLDLKQLKLPDGFHNLRRQHR